MNRFINKYWLQNRPLSVQLWVSLSLFGTIVVIAVFFYAAFFIFPGVELSGEQYRSIVYLLIMVTIANLFIAKITTQRITEPFEKLDENMSRIKNKDWDEKILQVARKDEVGCIINTLSQIQRNVVEINEDEEFFYQSVSHGLKTPIMVIQNCCAAYHDGIYGAEAIDIIMHESVAMENDIKKLLYVSSFQQMLGKQSDFKPVSLRELANDCQKRFFSNENEIAISVELPRDCVVLGNAEPLQTVFDNVVENALRYAVSYIRIYVEERGSDYILIFENDGSHIPPAVMDALFEKFYKGTSGNFGLGLYIAKNIVRFHAGDIWASNYDRGVRFHVLLKKWRAKNEQEISL